MTQEFFTRGGVLVPVAKVHDGFTTITDEPCHRCGGQGGSDAWKHTGWKCYRCNGRRFEDAREVRVYSAPALARLNATRDKRNAAKAAKAAALAAEIQARVDADRSAWYAVNGAVVDKARALADRNEFLRDLVARLDAGTHLWSEGQVAAAVKTVATLEERARLARASQYVGTIGERQEFTLTVERSSYFERAKFNATWLSETVHVTSMRDQEGNAFVVMSPAWNAPKGAVVTIKATIKQHNDYQPKSGGEATKQTVLSRVKEISIVEPKEECNANG